MEEEEEGEENDEDLLSFDYDSVAPKEDPAQFQLPEICLLTAYNPIPPNKQKNNTHNSILTFDSSWRDVSSFIFIHSELFSHRKRLHERHSRLRCEKRGEKRLLPRPAQLHLKSPRKSGVFGHRRGPRRRNSRRLSLAQPAVHSPVPRVDRVPHQSALVQVCVGRLCDVVRCISARNRPRTSRPCTSSA